MKRKISSFLYKAKRYLARNYKKVIVLPMLIVSIVVGSIIAYVQISRPNFVEGNLFDQKVMRLFWCEGLEKPSGATAEKFETIDFKDEKERRYLYECYTQNPIGESYLNELVTFFNQRKNKEFLLGQSAFDEGAIFTGGTYVNGNCPAEVKGTLYGGSEAHVCEFVFGNILDRKIRFSFVFGLENTLYLKHTRRIIATAYKTPNEDGLYKIVIQMCVTQNDRAVYRGAKRLKFMRLF